MVVAFYFRLHLAYFPRPVVAIFARPEQYLPRAFVVAREFGEIYSDSFRSVYKELHADHETGAADNK